MRCGSVIAAKNCSILAAVFQRLLEAGIYQRWGEESDGIKFSDRVKDRVKIIGPGRIAGDFDSTTPVVLRMEGKIITVFLLWTLCLAFSTVGFICEHIFDYHNNSVWILTVH